MKKHLSIWLLAILTILSSCNEEMEQPQSELMAVTIAVETESGILSRASYSEDDPLTRCLLEVRDADGLLVGEQHTAEVLADGSFTFDLRLNPAAKYDFLFWTDGGEAYYNTSDLTDITVANAEGTAGIACSGKLKRELLEPSMQIVLQHVVAKVTFKPTNKLNEESPLEIALPMYTSYNVVDGIVIGDVEERKASFTVNTAADNGSESAPSYSFYTLAAESDVQNITLSHEGYRVDLTNVPVMTNRHTVLTGRVGKIESRITAELSSTWTGDETISSIVLGKGLLSEDNMDYMLQCNQGTLAFEGDMSQKDMAVISSFCAHDSRVKRIDLSRCRMTEIPDRAFEESSSLEEVILPEGITAIGSYAFNWCPSLTSILLPASLRVIGGSSFQSCRSLKSVTLPGGLEQIGLLLFNNCNSLTSVTLGEGITTAGIEMFWSCSSLTTVTLPESFSIVPYSFFGYCSSLTSITLPANVTEIGGKAFLGCTALSSITLKGTTPPTIDKTAFDNASANYSIIVPKGCKQIYIDSSKGWDKYADHITETVE
jgi:hypothetical protein